MRAIGLGVIVLACLSGCTDDSEPPLLFGYSLDETLRLNHLRMKGTHNSYHVAPNPKKLDEWDYTHAPLARQLEEQGVRQFELDIHYRAREKRFLVYHLPGDDGSTCATLGACLGELMEWSNGHRGHHPIVVFLEPKDDIDAAEDAIAGRYADLDREILAAWPRKRVLVPDDVKGSHRTLAEAVRNSGWPTLGELRGKALFVLLDSDHGEGSHHYGYTHGAKSLDGRAMFVTATSEDPYAAVLSLDDPIGDAQAITAAARQNFLVRTRANDPVKDGKASTRAELEASVNGDAHMISTDFPSPGGIDNYWLDVGGAPSSCHPSLAPAGCTASEVESPDRLQPLSR
ncbi:MAG: hypothetical protein HY698_21170 [Deltaproteobacteria bacterium]|nr:hypothetical protein [Deltaproteobacteria bacterium]